jgi:hypothetical protein
MRKKHQQQSSLTVIAPLPTTMVRVVMPIVALW